jgi:hypothetical protein
VVLGDRFESLARGLVGGIEHGHEEFGGLHASLGHEQSASFADCEERMVAAEIVWRWPTESVEGVYETGKVGDLSSHKRATGLSTDLTAVKINASFLRKGLDSENLRKFSHSSIHVLPLNL